MENTTTVVLRLAGKILRVVAVISLLLLAIGYFLRWNGANFSSGFFAAGAILILLGILSLAGGYIQRANFGMLYAESAGQMNSAERAQRMAADITQRYGTLIFLVVTGLLLVGISAIIGKFL
jgi:hypothetical protein